MQKFTFWLQQRFADTEFVILILSILALISFFALAGKLLAPVLVSIVLAYLCDTFVTRLKAWKVPHTLAVSFVCLFFISIIILCLFFLLPLIGAQLTNLFNEAPIMLKKGEIYFTSFAQHYPNYLSESQIHTLINNYQADFARMGKLALTFSLTTIASLMAIVVYTILVPLMVFFWLNDRDRILSWLSLFLPKKRRLISEVWSETNCQIGNYIRAKIVEIIIVGIGATIAFALLGLNYAVLLGVLVGLSALVPYVGVVVVGLPVFLIGFLQWGLSAHFLYLVIFFAVWMAMDGNVLTPLLFSETLKIHPLAVIIAVLVFGKIWGFLGVFFAIPLAIVIKAVINAWLKSKEKIQPYRN